MHSADYKNHHIGIRPIGRVIGILDDTIILTPQFPFNTADLLLFPNPVLGDEGLIECRKEHPSHQDSLRHEIKDTFGWVL